MSNQFPIEIQIKKAIFLGYQNKPGDPYNNNIAHPEFYGAFNCDICSGFSISNDTPLPAQCPGSGNSGKPQCSQCNAAYILPCSICSALGFSWSITQKGLPNVFTNLLSCEPDQSTVGLPWVKEILAGGADKYNLIAYSNPQTVKMSCAEAALLSSNPGGSIILNKTEDYNGPEIVSNLCNPTTRTKCCLGDLKSSSCGNYGPATNNTEGNCDSIIVDFCNSPQGINNPRCACIRERGIPDPNCYDKRCVDSKIALKTSRMYNLTNCNGIHTTCAIYFNMDPDTQGNFLDIELKQTCNSQFSNGGATVVPTPTQPTYDEQLTTEIAGLPAWAWIVIVIGIIAILIAIIITIQAVLKKRPTRKKAINIKK